MKNWMMDPIPNQTITSTIDSSKDCIKNETFELEVDAWPNPGLLY